MKNVLDILNDTYERALRETKFYRGWAKDTEMPDLQRNRGWELAFKNLAIAKEFKKAIKLIENYGKCKEIWKEHLKLKPDQIDIKDENLGSAFSR